MKTKLLLLLLCLAGAIVLTVRADDEEEPTPPVPVEAPPPPPAAVRTVTAPGRTGRGNEGVGVIDFQGTPLAAVLEYYARLTNRSIIAAPNLAGSIYFRSQTNLTREEAIQALDSVLALNGIGIVPMGEKFLKVVQIATAKQEGIAVKPVAEEGLPAADTLTTRIIALQYADINDVLGALQPYMHAYGQLIPLSKSNSILVTDTGGNINQMLEIVKHVDQPSQQRMQTKVYQIQHAKAGDVMARLQAIVQETQAAGLRGATTPPGAPTPPTAPTPTPSPFRSTRTTTATEETAVEGKVIMTADERTNKILILSRESNYPFFDRLIEELDIKVDPDVIVRVVELNYANAEDVASLVTSLVSGNAPTTVRRTTGPAGTRTVVNPPAAPVASAAAAALTGDASFLQFASGIRILPDPRMNSLVLMATRADMDSLIEVIRSVDSAVAQVLVEVVIGEVKLSGDMQMGVDLIKRLFTQDGVNMYGGMKTGTSGSPTPLDLTAAAIGSTPSGAALASALTYYATFKDLKLDAVVRLLSTSNKFKVLSTPIIQTLHNQEASIIVGESRPVATSTLSDVVGGSGSNTTTSLRSNIDYKDIAIELKVTPRINPEGMVTVEIEQKVNEAGEEKDIGGVRVPVITKREARSTVTVKDQGTIVLGGLIKESKTQSETKVPFLGDIPLIGLAFRDKSTRRERTELIVFIRPTVLRTHAEAQAEADRRRRLMRSGEELGIVRQLRAREELEESTATPPPAPPDPPTNP